MKGKKQMESRCPASETLAPSLSESGWAFCFEMEFLFSFFRTIGWLHTQPVKATAVNNRIYFWDRGSKQSLESHPRVIYSPKVCLFFFFLLHEILRTGDKFSMPCWGGWCCWKAERTFPRKPFQGVKSQGRICVPNEFWITCSKLRQRLQGPCMTCQCL